MTKRAPAPSWREFERVVAMIEEGAAPRGATVRSPDRIRDLTTGELREVDASVRFRLGTVDILITVECQRRSRKANDMWIEQLATKRLKIGAAKTIAVSARGFTKAARITAAHNGIELRTLSEVTPTDVEDWFLPGAVAHAIPSTENMGCAVRFEGSSDYVGVPDPWLACFFHDWVQSPFPAATLWAFHEMAHPRRFAALPRDGSVTRVQFDLDATDTDLIPAPMAASQGVSCLEIELDGMRRPVADVRISADVSIHVISIDSTEGVHHAYEGTDGNLAQHARFKGEAFDLPVTFDHFATPGGQSVIAEFPSGARLSLGWKDNVLPGQVERRTCAFCDARPAVGPSNVLPDFLVPRGLSAKEWFLCADCSSKFEEWDDYVEDVWRHLPTDLTGMLHGAFGVGGVDGTLVKSWLLSVLWRMGASQALSTVDLGADAAVLRSLLKGDDLQRSERYPVVCVALSSDGERVGFFFPPQWSDGDGQRVLSVVLEGVLFNFGVGMDAADCAELVTGDEWIFPILDWRKVDFLVDAALKARTEKEKGRMHS